MSKQYRPSDLIKVAVQNPEMAEEQIQIITQIVRGAEMKTCKDIISTLKALIKSKKVTVQGKVIALDIFHAGMMTGNLQYLLYAQKKVMSRFTIFAAHRKESNDPDRGRDLFKSKDPTNMQYSAEFHKKLLNYIYIWATNYGIGPEGKHSDFYTAYQKLKSLNVHFPSQSSGSGRRSQGSRKSQNIPRPDPFGDPQQGISSPQPRPRHSHNPATSSQPIHQTASPTLSHNFKTQKAEIENSINLLNDLRRSGSSDDLCQDLIANLASMKIVLQDEISVMTMSGQTQNIEELIQLNDRIQSTISTQPQSRPRPRHSTPPKANQQNLLDLDFDSPPRPAAFATHVPSSRPQHEQDLFQVFGSGGQAMGGPQSNQQLEKLQKEFDMYQDQYNKQQQACENAQKQIQMIYQENQRLKAEIQQRQGGGQQIQAEIQKVLQDMKNESLTNQQLQGVIEKTNAELQTTLQMIQQLKLQQSQGMGTGFHTNIAAPIPNPNDFFSGSSNNSKGRNPFRQSSSSSSSSSSFDDDEFNQPVPPQPPVVVNYSTNELFFKNCCITDKGVLYDDQDIQVGIRLQVMGNMGQGQLYIGNKSQEVIQYVKTQINDDPEDGLQVTANVSEEYKEFSQGQQVNRKLQFNVTSIFDKIPTMDIQLQRQSGQKYYKLQLPLVITKFLTPYINQDVYQLYEQFAGSETEIRIQNINSSIMSPQDLIALCKLGGNFRVFGRDEIKELSPGMIICAAHKSQLVVVVMVMMVNGSNVLIKCRCPNQKLCDAVASVFKLLIANQFIFEYGFKFVESVIFSCLEIFVIQNQ